MLEVRAAGDVRVRRRSGRRLLRAARPPPREDDGCRLVRQHRAVANAFGADRDRCVAHWKAYVRQADRHVAALGSRALELRYEDLTSTPETELARLASFLQHPIRAWHARETAATGPRLQPSATV